MSMKNIFLLLLSINFNFSAVKLESCTIESSGVTGQCVALSECPLVTELYKRDRSNSPNICNKKLRLICCPNESEATEFLHTTEINSNTLSANENGQSEHKYEHYNYQRIVKMCSEYKTQMKRNETTTSFILGEPSIMKEVDICNTNRADNGIATGHEFPHSAFVEGKFKFSQTSTIYTNKCLGSLVSHNFIVTTSKCIDRSKHFSTIVRVGNIKYDTSSEHEKSFEIGQINIYTQRPLTLLKLPQKMLIDEFITPLCLPPNAFYHYGDAQFVLSGWSGNEFECNKDMKKWNIRRASLRECNQTSLCVNAEDIVNYYETLLPGSPLHIYHPENECQYILIGVFSAINRGKYEFIDITKKKHIKWIENIIWPKKLNHMNRRVFHVINFS